MSKNVKKNESITVGRLCALMHDGRYGI